MRAEQAHTKQHSQWARQLLKEHENICWQYKLSLSPAIIEIANTKKQLGSWNSGLQIIRISSHLIATYPWETTINILKHEMAHQLCSEYHLKDKTPHGGNFQKACQAIALPLEFRGASQDLRTDSLKSGHTNTFSETDTARKFISRIKKLLALAQSANEHEATLAMEKANALITKYNIEQLQETKEDNYTYVIINPKKKIIESYKRQICFILKNYFYVKVIFSSQYDPFSDQCHKTIELLGRQENVTVAEYCYHFLENQLKVLWQQNRHIYNTGQTKTNKNSYYLGLLQGFHAKLQHQQAQININKPANNQKGKHSTLDLILVEDQQLNEYIAHRFPRLKTIRHKGPRLYKETFDDGVTRGKKIIFHRGLESKSGYKGNLIQ